SDEEIDLVGATAQMEANKGKRSSVASVLTGERAHTGEIRSIVFACDAGMGSSAMGASVLRKKIRDAGHDEVTVVNKAISDLSDTYDLVVTHQDLTERARERTPSAMHVSVDNFMGSPRYDEIVELVDQGSTGAEVPLETVPSAGVEAAADGSVLSPTSVVLGGTATSRDAAIDEAGQLLLAAGAVEPSYVAAMHERERSVSTFMGNGLAIPHGTNDAKAAIRRTAISFVRYDEPVDWNGQRAEFVVGIAGAGDDHLALLARLAETFTDPERVARLREARVPEEVLDVLEGVRV
ncbi:PTS sugar transporter subunit IIA, partial [Nocardioides sp. CER28]